MGPWRFLLAAFAALSVVGVSFLDNSGVAAAGTPMTTVQAGTSGAPGETMVTGHSCDGVFHGSPPGSLVETTSAGPNDSTVTPGQAITVMLTWNPSDFSGSTPDKTVACVKIGSTISTILSQEHKPGPAGSNDTFSVVVPTGGTGGQAICLRGAVSGPGHDTEKSPVLCYDPLGAATPEVPHALLLPVAGLLLAAGAVLLAGRRSSRARPDVRS